VKGGIVGGEGEGMRVGEGMGNKVRGGKGFGLDGVRGGEGRIGSTSILR